MRLRAPSPIDTEVSAGRIQDSRQREGSDWVPSPLPYVVLPGGALLMLAAGVVKSVGQSLPVAQFPSVHGANETAVSVGIVHLVQR